ncbi:hypothetical protein CDA64_01848 [Lactobacillus helveticus]|nr:hypothetical protein CDA64_01848 [Lactobacillus helveticus]
MVAVKKEEKASISDGLYGHHYCAFTSSIIDVRHTCR